MAGSMAMRHLNSSGSICRCCASNGTQSIFLSPWFSAAIGKSTISERLELPQNSALCGEIPGERRVLEQKGSLPASPTRNSGRETHVTGHSASLSAFALLGKNTPRARTRGRNLELSRDSGVDASSQAHTDDRRLSPNPHPSSRGRVLLRHAAYSSRHRKAGYSGCALSERSGGARKGRWLVDREGLFHECRMPHDRQYAGASTRTHR